MTTLLDSARLAQLLSERVGLSVLVTTGVSSEGSYAEIRPSEIRANTGFVIAALLGWRHVRAEVRLESFAADLLQSMALASEEQHAQFSAIARLLAERGGRITMSVAGVLVDPEQPSTWPEEWNTLSLSVERTPLMIEHHDPALMEAILIFWGGSLLGMMIALLADHESGVEASLEHVGLPEGARQRVEVNRYERSRINRSLCIARHGTACSVCAFDFESVYGELGKEFTHVHHVVPVSRLGPGYLIDPAADLLPVCPNCHAMLHRREPPFTVDELRRRIIERSELERFPGHKAVPPKQ